MPSTRTKRHQRTKQAILDAAVALIAEQGPTAVSMRALAERIEYSPAGLYEYFASKEEILAAVCEEGQRYLYEAMSQADPTVPPADYLYQLGRAYIQFALHQPDYFLLMFSAPVPAEVLTAETDSAYALLVQAITWGVEQGVFPVRPHFGVAEMTYAAWTLVHGMAMLRVTNLRHSPADLDTADEQAQRNFLRGLMA